MDTKDEQYHLRCIDLAYKGLGLVAPNPLVGALFLAENRIVGEGYHSQFGGPHAEVNAVKHVKDDAVLKKATLLVNLEPCSHYGKTPPCSQMIIDKSIKRVIIGEIDPFPKVSGRGVKMLQQANIEVSIGLHKAGSRFINRRFFTFHEKKRPYVILKWAESFDGYLDKIRNINEPPRWITDLYGRILVHKWRTQEQAILIGTNTALMDNPQLTARYYFGKNPVRMVLDRTLRLPGHLHVFDQQAPTVVFTQQTQVVKTNITFAQIPFRNAPFEIMEYCYQNNIQSIIVEGGSKLLQSFIEANLWDEARVFKGDVIFENGIKAPALNAKPRFNKRFENSTLFFYFNDEWDAIANIDYL